MQYTAAIRANVPMAAAMNRPTLALSLSTRASAEAQTQDGAHQSFHVKILLKLRWTGIQHLALPIQATAI